MQRSRIALWTTIAILAAAVPFWFLVVAPRFNQTPAAPKPSSDAAATSTTRLPGQDRHSALNLYLTAPPELPAGALRAELTLLRAVLTDAAGRSATAFEGSQRVLLQQGVAQQVFSERIPDGRWTRLALVFSAAAEFIQPDGGVQAALLGRTRAEFGFDANVGASRSLALFALVPLERGIVPAERAVVVNLAAEPQAAETYVFGGFLLEPRDRGEILEISEPTLQAVIKKDLGFDLSISKPGSSGFQPAGNGVNPPR